MKETLLVGSWLIGISFIAMLITYICTFVSRVWCYINKKPVNKIPFYEYLFVFIAPMIIGLFFLTVVPIGIFINQAWKHFNQPPCIIKVSEINGNNASIISVTSPESNIPVYKE